MRYTVERTSGAVLTVRSKIAPDWNQRLLGLSDIHLDSHHCDRKLLKAQLDDALADDAGIFIVGDLLDVMQGRSDKRGSKGDLMPRHRGDNYIDLVLDDAFEFLLPYAANILFISDGNHETSVRKWTETDLIARLCKALGVQKMGYAGFTRFLFEHECGGTRSSKMMYFHHGSGGGGEVTLGTPRSQREAGSVTADIYIGGHTHTSWLVERSRVRVTDSGRVMQDTTTHISIPGFKNEYDLENPGFHIEKGRSPRPMGGFWLEFFWNRRYHGNVAFRAYKAV